MLPVFTKSRAVLNKSFERYQQQEITRFSGPLFGNIPVSRNWEGLTLTSEYADKTTFTSEIKPISGQISIDIDKTLDDPGLVYRYISQLTAQLAQGQIAMAIGTIHDLTTSRGQVTSGNKITPETMLEGYRKIEIVFDSNGEPLLPQVVADPVTADVIEAAIREMMETPKYRAEFEQIIEEKRKLFNDREDNRKLVD